MDHEDGEGRLSRDPGPSNATADESGRRVRMPPQARRKQHDHGDPREGRRQMDGDQRPEIRFGEEEHPDGIAHGHRRDPSDPGRCFRTDSATEEHAESKERPVRQPGVDGDDSRMDGSEPEDHAEPHHGNHDLATHEREKPPEDQQLRSERHGEPELLGRAIEEVEDLCPFDRVVRGARQHRGNHGLKSRPKEARKEKGPQPGFQEFPWPTPLQGARQVESRQEEEEWHVEQIHRLVDGSGSSLLGQDGGVHQARQHVPEDDQKDRPTLRDVDPENSIHDLLFCLNF